MAFSVVLVKFQMIVFFVLATNLLGLAVSENKYKEGESGLTAKIHGGETASIKEAPFAVAIFIGESYACTFSIISPRTVIGVAHCLIDKKKEQYPVNSIHGRVGSIDIEKGKNINFFKINIHQQYLFLQNQSQSQYPVLTDYDISTIFTDKKITFSENINSIPLVPANFHLLGEMVTHYGWGILHKRTRKYSQKLQKVNGMVISIYKCQGYVKNLPLKFKISHNQICTLVPFPRYLYKGDSGGPVVYRTENAQFLIGVHVGGDNINVGLKDDCTINTSVQKFSAWIMENFLFR